MSPNTLIEKKIIRFSLCLAATLVSGAAAATAEEPRNAGYLIVRAPGPSSPGVAERIRGIRIDTDAKDSKGVLVIESASGFQARARRRSMAGARSAAFVALHYGVSIDVSDCGKPGKDPILGGTIRDDGNCATSIHPVRFNCGWFDSDELLGPIDLERYKLRSLADEPPQTQRTRCASLRAGKY